MAHFLVIDDDPTILLAVATLLRHAGYEVTATSNPEEAVELAAGRSLDAIVLDVKMPGLSGFDVLEALRSEPRTRAIPVLFLSSRAGGADRVRGLRQGASDYLAKPFEPEELLLRLQRLIRGPAGGEGVAPRPVAAGEDPLALLVRRLRTSRGVGEVRLGRYQVLEVLGEGAMGMVFRGHDPKLERAVALKTIRVDRIETSLDRQEMVAMLLREAVTVARFSHPNIVAVYDVEDAPEAPFMVMELVEGMTLERYLWRIGSLAPERAVPVGLGIARALAASHARGIVHGDVKPGNVLLGRNGAIKVTDFGLAGLLSSFCQRPDQLFGTPGYLPPESLRGEGYDELGDLFGLGATLYQCLSGHRPFVGEVAERVLFSTLFDAVMPLRSLVPTVPQEIEGVVMGLVEKERSRRLASAADVVARLERVAAVRDFRWTAEDLAVIEAYERAGELEQPAESRSVMVDTGPFKRMEGGL